jgi:hypothetical protein
MQLTIIPSDDAVYVDGLMKAYVPLPLDLTQCGIPSDVHALQWKDTAGWIEFKDNPDGSKPLNEPITELPSWANACIDVWNNWTPYVEPYVELILPNSQQPNTTGTQTA